MEKIYTIRNLNQQQEHMWRASRVKDEVAACSLCQIEGWLLRRLPRETKIPEAGCGLGSWVVFLRERGYEGLRYKPKIKKHLHLTVN